MKKYVIVLSRTFPKWHPRAGEPTYFGEKAFETIMYERNGTTVAYDWPGKYHTIRGNYDLWRKRFEKIDRGEACLVLKQWSGVPYRSKQETIALLTKEDGIGLQKLEFYNGCLQQPILSSGLTIRVESLAQNDGLSLEDWEAWFKSDDLTKPHAIIQLTKFRY